MESEGVRNPRYRIDENQQATLQKIREFQNTDFKEVKRTLNKDGEVISKVEKLTPNALIEIPENHQIKRVSTNVSTQQQWVISEPIKGVEKAIQEIDFFSIFKDKIKPIIVANLGNICDKGFDRIIYSDAHIGMDVSK